MKTATIHSREVQTTEDPELAGRFNKVLGETVEAMEEAGIRYVFIGGIASGGLGRPRSTRDIDLFVVPEDADLTLRALARRGFRTEKTDPSWLYKGFKEDILVDVIFKSKGEIYLDPEMYQRVITAEFHGKRLKLVAPEDLLIIKAAAHSELTPNHWHDAIALLSHATIDWQYLIKRARRAPRRTLSLLLYAQSNDIWVPNHIIHELYSGIFDYSIMNKEEPKNLRRPPALMHEPTPEPPPEPPKEERIPRLREVDPIHPPPPRAEISRSQTSAEKLTQKKQLTYGVAHLRERLAEDSRTNELDIQIEQVEDKIVLRGEVQQEERKVAVERIAMEVFPRAFIDNQVFLVNFEEPEETEDLQ
jgi:predicted nucleotidyltransferase